MNESLRNHFILDERLGIRLPALDMEWESYSTEERADILLEWEEIRATIPDQIIRIETVIIEKTKQMSEEENFIRSCELNSEIHELASVINDLNIWFRVQQDHDTKVHQ
ncbi:hypothetical protein P9761_10465 [Brevibacillus centrosporus]|nr:MULTISPECIES: hypothetical protein [Brevibacillus]MEC2132538.1 hypothetical protein [Brevibacillus centrosporus]MED1794056.1 hypothetical protein [Brevibacillus nitrificans]MED1950652.1 hypothetical protein [Brevibacillus centrosporus]MED4908636.1 hypothetical protein [Brevibacillus centrosporus]